jgi:hypothetical protein
MCYAYGSVDQAVNPCPMCKVFPHTRSVLLRTLKCIPISSVLRCPHQRDICRNRSSHPRMDVLYLKNAEGEYKVNGWTSLSWLGLIRSTTVDSFNGCGYCKVRKLKSSLLMSLTTAVISGLAPILHQSRLDTTILGGPDAADHPLRMSTE